MTGYVRVGKVTEFEDGVIRNFEIEGVDVAVVNWRDRFYAFGNHCPHWGVSLADAAYITKDDEIVCCFHYACFDMATGRHIDGPGLRGMAHYEVRVEADDVLVEETASVVDAPV